MTQTEISETGTAGQRAAAAGQMGARLAEHRPFLLRLAHSQLERTAAEDAVQETLMAAWMNASAFRQESSLRTWLVSILRNKIVDQIRQRRRASREPLGKAGQRQEDCAQERAPEGGDSALDGHAHGEAVPNPASVRTVYAGDAVRCGPHGPDAPYFGDEDPFSTQFDREGAWLHENVDGHPDASSQVEQAQLLRLIQACLEGLPPKTSRVFLMREYLGFEASEVAEETGLTPGNVRVVLYRARMSLKTCLALKLPGEL
jgi:RNA polymerase sigma-70 factor (ECF subfamily)